MGSFIVNKLVLDARQERRSDNDEALVAGLRRGDRSAAESLVSQYGARVYRLAFRITGKHEDAEEVAQDALWTAARKIHSFKGESAFGSWLYRIAANAAYQKLRRRKLSDREVPLEDILPRPDTQGPHLEAIDDWSAKVEGPAVQEEVRDVLRSAVDALPPDYRTAFVLHDVEGLSNPEIARSLGLSLPAVKSRIHRSRLFLRQRLSYYMAQV